MKTLLSFTAIAGFIPTLAIVYLTSGMTCAAVGIGYIAVLALAAKVC